LYFTLNIMTKPSPAAWTINKETGHPYGSDEFSKMVVAVDKILEDESHEIISGKCRLVAVRIMDMLAHVYDLAPEHAELNTDWTVDEENLAEGQLHTSHIFEEQVRYIGNTLNECSTMIKDKLSRFLAVVIIQGLANQKKCSQKPILRRL